MISCGDQPHLEMEFDSSQLEFSTQDGPEASTVVWCTTLLLHVIVHTVSQTFRYRRGHVYELRPASRAVLFKFLVDVFGRRPFLGG